MRNGWNAPQIAVNTRGASGDNRSSNPAPSLCRHGRLVGLGIPGGPITMTGADVAEFIGICIACWAFGFCSGFIYRTFIKVLEFGKGD